MKRTAEPLSSLISGALSFVLPGACASCAAPCAGVLCVGCAACLEDCGARCARCALLLTPIGVCRHCLDTTSLLDGALCVADYTPPADTLVLALKFHGRLALAGHLGQTLARRALAAKLTLPELIAPVPLSSRRLMERGYNQAWEIARPFARRVHRPAQARLLVRCRNTLAQAELPAAQRRLNMRRAFRVARPEAVCGRHIGIVDDVMTSGATLEAAARALKEAGAVRVTAFVVLRTPEPVFSA